MSYCILRMHKRRLLLKEFDMDKINEFLNHKLPEDFIYSDDQVMEKLELCIDKITRFKFASGPLIETIPANELPKIPFGDFKKVDKNEIINQIVQKSSEQSKSSVGKDRNAAVEQMAKDRLEIEKKKQEEMRRLKRQLSKEAAEAGTAGDSSLHQANQSNSLDKLLNKSGRPILNISDDDDEDDEDDLNDTDSDDDLNPSKISEYDEEKAEKESIISNATRCSTNFHLHKHQNDNSLSSSQVSLELIKSNNTNHSDSPYSSLSKVKAKPPNHPQIRPFVRQTSEYENYNKSQLSNGKLTFLYSNKKNNHLLVLLRFWVIMKFLYLRFNLIRF